MKVCTKLVCPHNDCGGDWDNFRQACSKCGAPRMLVAPVRVIVANPQPPPRYDDVFFSGVEWLNNQ